MNSSSERYPQKLVQTHRGRNARVSIDEDSFRLAGRRSHISKEVKTGTVLREYRPSYSGVVTVTLPFRLDHLGRGSHVSCDVNIGRLFLLSEWH